MTTTTEQPAIPDAPATTRYAAVQTKHLVPHPKNVRVDVGDVTDLAASIKAQGVLQPLVVAPVAGKKSAAPRWVVIAGHRRLAGAKVARLAEVPCIVREDLVEEADQLQAMLVENGQRVDLTPVEEGDAYRALTIDYGVPVNHLAAKVGRSPQLVRGRITLAGSPESVRTRVIAGQVPMEQAIALAEFEDDGVAHAALESVLGSATWPWTLQMAKDRRVAVRQLRTEVKLAERNRWRLLTPEEWQAVNDDEAERLDVLAEDAEATAREAVYAAHADEDGEVDGPGEQAVEEAGAAAVAAFERDAHATCPGHAGVTYEDVSFSAMPHVRWVCLQARLHDNATGHTGLDDVDAEASGVGATLGARAGVQDDAAGQARKAQEARALREQQEAALAAAAKVRRRHLGDYVRRTDDKAARRHLVARIARDSTTARWGARGQSWAISDVLGITFPPARALPEGDTSYEERQALAHKDAADRADVVTDALSGWDLAALVGLLSLVAGLDDETELESADPWPWRRKESWLRQIAATGYEWSPVERGFLPEAMHAELDEAEAAAAEAAS